MTAILEVSEATEHKMTGDFTFLDAEDQVVARLTGYEAIMDASLIRAFSLCEFVTEKVRERL